MAITAAKANTYNNPLGLGSESGVYLSGGLGVAAATGLSSDIPISTSPTAIFTANGGDIYLDNVIIEVGATGLAGGTTFELIAGGTIGLPVFFSEAVSSLSANTTFDFLTATVKQKTIIRNGQTISLGSTVAKCTGSAVWILTIIYRPVVESAVLTPFAFMVTNNVNPHSPV